MSLYRDRVGSSNEDNQACSAELRSYEAVMVEVGVVVSVKVSCLGTWSIS